MSTPPTASGGLRRRIGDARAAIVGTRGLRARAQKHTAAISRLRERSDAQDARLTELRALVKELQRAATLNSAERDRRDAQLGAVEVRLADLEERLADLRAAAGGGAPDATDTPGVPDSGALSAGRSLLEEVRTEHARIRARMQVVSAYEERLRRVEESVAELYEGDTRHPV